MNHLISLTKEEIKYVCTVIPYQETMLYFKKYPKEFTKIRPGFRVKALNEDMIIRTLYEFRNRDFIASYLNKHIENWIKEIDEELNEAKETGYNMEAAYINVLPRSFFARNIELFFKIKGEEKSEDYLRVLNAAIEYESDKLKKEEEERNSINKEITGLKESQIELKQQIADKQAKLQAAKTREKEFNQVLDEKSRDFAEELERYRKSAEENYEKYTVLRKAYDNEVWKTSEMQQKIDILSARVEEQTENANTYKASVSELESKLSSAEEDIQTWKNQVRNREKQLFTYKAERATLLTDKEADKKQIKELKEALEQAISVEISYKEQIPNLCLETEDQTVTDESKSTVGDQRIVETLSMKCYDSERRMPMCPEDMDDFLEYFSYNLENIGFNQSEDGAFEFLNYMKNIVFHGVPILIKRGAGINLANALANTLYGVPIAARLLYAEGTNIQSVDRFLANTPDRVVCIDGFIGNCNIIEFIPVLEQYRNKIIILTYMFDRTLTFVPNEILAHINFISVDVFSSLLRIKDITEDPSEIKEKPFPIIGNGRVDERLHKIFKDIACECGIEVSAAITMANIIEDENQLNEMLMFTLLPYVSKVFEKNPYNCSKRLQRYAGETGRCLRKDIMMRWFG